MLEEIPAGLYDRVINRISREERVRLLKSKLIFDFSGLILSLAAFLPLTMKFTSEVADSGLSQFLSLLFTDFAIVMANAGDYVLSLLEAMPALSLTLTLATLLALVFCSAKLADAYADFKKLKLINL